MTGVPVRCWWYSSPSRRTCCSAEAPSRNSNCSRGAPSRFSRCSRASRVGSGLSPATSPRRSTTHAPRNWSLSAWAARTASAVRPAPGSPCSTTTVGRVCVEARAACTHWAICASSARRPVNGPSACGRCPKDCSSTTRVRAAALRSPPRNWRPTGAVCFFGAREVGVSMRCWSRYGRMPRTSRAVSHWSRNCSAPPGCPAAPARRWAAGQCEAVAFATVVAVPATATAAPAPSARPVFAPSARSAPNAAAAATPVTSRGVPRVALLKRSESGRSPAATESSAWVYAAYSSPALAAMVSSAARARDISAPASVRPPVRRVSSSTARTNSLSASARWLSRICVPLRVPRSGPRVPERRIPSVRYQASGQVSCVARSGARGAGQGAGQGVGRRLTPAARRRPPPRPPPAAPERVGPPTPPRTRPRRR
ncbi:hypothetical protein M2436_004796 [Streptomyces sp. HB372]|nr:hypothetical protein [Streptomyces sp. HB372]